MFHSTIGAPLIYCARQAQKALETVRPHLAGYVIRYNKWPVLFALQVIYCMNAGMEDHSTLED